MAKEGERLASLAAAVRESTLKRLRRVPAGAENRRPDPEAMSFADLAAHIADADRHLFAVLAGEERDPAAEGVLGPDRTQAEYGALLAELERLGNERRDRLLELDDAALERVVHDVRFGETTIWWVVARGCLDHETHHRGQIAAWLRLLRHPRASAAARPGQRGQ